MTDDLLHFRMFDGAPGSETPLSVSFISDACFESLAISYARSFVSSIGDGHKLPILPKRLRRELSDEEEAMHLRLLEMRRKVYAHSDSDVHEVGIRERDGRWSAWSVSVKQPHLHRLSKEDIGTIKSLVEKLCVAVMIEINSIAKRLSKQGVLPL
ncbi:hypothetical protein [Rubrivirga marina]|uniref:hypothetical protein n=1 Tax=Rubrivirga marina TaxID=1196024 RepID=UPI00117AA7A3|nr:hypothetical protein [Rubrivirga marina]